MGKELNIKSYFLAKLLKSHQKNKKNFKNNWLKKYLVIVWIQKVVAQSRKKNCFIVNGFKYKSKELWLIA